MGLLAGEGAEALLGLGAKVLRELFLGNTLQDIGGEAKLMLSNAFATLSSKL